MSVDKRWVITDSRSSFSTSDFAIPGEELGLGPAAYCRKRTLSGGRQSGVEIIELSNGVVTLRICPTRGMGIIDGSFGGPAGGPPNGHTLGWQSPVREIVHPAYINLYDLGGRGAHYGFNELLNRCGIEWSGAMGEDEAVDNMGNRTPVFLPLHGKVGWTPASRVELAASDGEVCLEGDVPEQNVFGVNYLLKTRLTLRAGTSRIEIRDTLCNLGALPGEYEMLYHINFGPPILEAGSRYYANYQRVVPRDSFAAAGMGNLSSFPGPSAGFIEQVFLFRGAPDDAGWAHQLLANADQTLAVRVSYGVRTLPYVILWKRCAALEEGYVAGLNPCSDLPSTRRVERAGGRLKTIAAGEEADFSCIIEPIEGPDRVAAAVAGIERFRTDALVGKAGDSDWL